MLSNILQGLNKRKLFHEMDSFTRTLIRGLSVPYFLAVLTEYGEIPSISPYSVRMRENTDQKTPITDTFHTVILYTLNLVDAKTYFLIY